MTETYRVGGMTCVACANTVSRALRRLDPKARVSVDVVDGKVSIEATLPKDAVRRAIEAAGFTFEG